MRSYHMTRLLSYRSCDDILTNARGAVSTTAEVTTTTSKYPFMQGEKKVEKDSFLYSRICGS